MKIIIVDRPPHFRYCSNLYPSLLLVALVSELIVDYDNFCIPEMVKLPFTSIVSLMVFTSPSTVHLSPFRCDNQGAEVSHSSLASDFRIFPFVWGNLSSSSSFRNRFAFISHMQISYDQGRTIIC